ncbi:hypothetical protein CSPX01_06292 [Colletotrichum filicis]|nr:hypothetical protein CSPX01_06292 [Colletotrichum filicis]
MSRRRLLFITYFNLALYPSLMGISSPLNATSTCFWLWFMPETAILGLQHTNNKSKPIELDVSAMPAGQVLSLCLS